MATARRVVDGLAMDAVATIEASRQRGDDRFDPVRFHRIESLARRAAGCDGAARAILDGKVTALLAAYREDLDKAPAANAATPPGQPPRGPLGELVDHMARHGAALEPGTAPGLSPVPELKTVRYFRSTWSKLSADQKLMQSLAQMPQNAGPLNSQRLVHRALQTMRDLSPEYLHSFMAYLDALLWLDQAHAGSPFTGKDVVLAERDRKRPRGKAR